jgi:hypothetical protein
MKELRLVMSRDLGSRDGERRLELGLTDRASSLTSGTAAKSWGECAGSYGFAAVVEGAMLWLKRKTFSGSYLSLSATSFR